MAFQPNFKSSGSHKREPIPTGQYDARCYGVVALGTKENFNKFKNITENVTNMMILFEIPELQIEWEKEGVKTVTPRAMYPRFTVSMHAKANLRKFIEAWFGKKFKEDTDAYHFDFGKLIGHCAQLSVELNDAGYSNISAIAPLHKSVKLDDQFNAPINFGIEDINTPEWNKLYPWLQNIIKESQEYIALMGASTEEETVIESAEEDDIPF